MTKKSEVVQCSWLEDHQHSIKKPRGSQGERRQEAKKDSQNQRMVVRGQREKYKMGRREIRGLKTRVSGNAILAEGGLDCTVKIYRSEESEERVTVLRIGTQHWGQFQE